MKKNDEKYPIFKPGKNGKETADYDIFRQFLSTLNIHDQTILMSMVSTSQDPVDVLALNIDFVVNQPDGNRLYWEGERTKTGEAFTLISKEDEETVRAIERLLGSKIERRVVDNFDYAKPLPLSFHGPNRPQRGPRSRQGQGRAKKDRTASPRKNFGM